MIDLPKHMNPLLLQVVPNKGTTQIGATPPIET